MSVPSQRSTIFTIILGCLFIGTTALMYLLIDFESSTINFRYTSSAESYQEWSPYPRNLMTKTKEVVFDGAINEENIYRQSPSPQVDEAWRDLGISIRPLHIAREDAATMRLSTDHFQVEDDELGTSYPAGTEVFHQIHCLDLLRKSLWFNADYYKDLGTHEFGKQDDTLRKHITHCVDMLRQVLICNADVGLVPFVPKLLRNGTTTHFPDFSRPHMCRDYTAIKDWALEHAYCDQGSSSATCL